VSELYKPAGNGIFASRKAHRLAYRSQRQSPYDRAISQAFKRRQRLRADGGIGDPIAKPHGMRWATFDRKMEQVEAAEAVCDARLLRFVQKLSRYGSSEAVASIHAGNGGSHSTASAGALLNLHGSGACILPNTFR
jgi:hypothetical protein